MTPGSTSETAAPGSSVTISSTPVDDEWCAAIRVDDVGASADFREVVLKGMGALCSQFGGPQAYLLETYSSKAEQEEL